MACGCSDNKKLNDNKKLSNIKSLRLDDMKNMSIDEIVKLYKDGYTLDDTTYNLGTTSDIRTTSNPKIVSMGCGGYPTTDIYRPMDQQGGITIYKGTVGACKITPTSKCLDFIAFYGARRYSTSYNLYFEIREHDPATNLPKGNPTDPTGLIKQVTNTFETSFTSYAQTIDFQAELPAANVPYWITIRSSDYICGGGTTAGKERVELSYAWNVSGNNRAYFGPLVPCVWSFPGQGGDSWAMEVFRTTYIIPTDAQVYNYCWGSGLGTKCSPTPEQPAIPTGTTFPIKADIANMGGIGNVRVVFKANGSPISDQTSPSPLATYTDNEKIFWSPTVSYTMPNTDVTLTIEGYSWNGAWVLTSTQTTTISKSTPTCTGVRIDANTISANVGDTITLTAYDIIPTTQQYNVIFTDRSNTVLGTCITANGECSVDWDTTGKTEGTYYVKAAVIGQCTSSELVIGLSMPIVQRNVDIYVIDSTNSNPIQGANVTIGVQTLQTDASGYIRFRVDAGNISGTITKTGYNNFNILESIYVDSTFTYPMVPTTQTPGSLRFGIVAPGSTSDAAIQVDGINKGNSDPTTGFLIVTNLSVGSHPYTVSKTEYNSSSGSATVSSSTQTDVPVTLTLATPNTGNACMKSTPPGASITIGGTLQTGKTTASSAGDCIGTNIIQNLTPGTYNYTLSLAGHQNKPGSFTITAGTTVEADAGALTPLPNLGTLNISSVPDEARIYIMVSGVYQDTQHVTGTSTDPTVITTLVAGAHSYKLTLTGYQDYINTFNITAGQTTTVSPTLVPTVLTTGSLSIASYPEGAEIYVETDNTFQDTSHITGPIGTPTIIPDLSVGSHRYKLTYPDYQDSIGTFAITANHVTPINVTMTRPGVGGDSGGAGILFGLVGIAALGMMMSSKSATSYSPTGKVGVRKTPIEGKVAIRESPTRESPTRESPTRESPTRDKSIKKI